MGSIPDEELINVSRNSCRTVWVGVAIKISK
jgi:hypothetical protein